MKRNDIIHLVLIVLFVGISINLTVTTINMLKNRNRLRELEQEVAILDEKSKKINESIEYKKTDQFVEEFARDELNLVKPGEDVIVVAKDNKEPETQISYKDNQTNVDIKDKNIQKSVGNKNVEAWKKLFF